MTRPPDDLEAQEEAEERKAREIRKLLDRHSRSWMDSNLAPPVNAVVAARIQRARSRGSATSEENPRQRSSLHGSNRQG